VSSVIGGPYLSLRGSAGVPVRLVEGAVVSLGQQKKQKGPIPRREESRKNAGGGLERLKRTRLGRRLRFARLRSSPLGRPSPLILSVASILFSVFLLAGGIFVQLEDTGLAWTPSASEVSVAWPSLYSQTTAEAYLVGSLYLLAIAGLFLCFLSAKYAYRPRYAHIGLLSGLVLLLISFYLSWDIMSAKMSGQTWPRP